jgi:hypothetical protein
MTTESCGSNGIQRTLYLILAVSLATLPTASAIAQTNAAAMAVRQRVEGLQAAPEGQPAAASPESPHQVSAEGPVSSSPSAGAAVPGKLDTRYISSNAAAVIVLRPAQILASPIAQVFPVEVASAAGLSYIGFDPAEMEEVIAFAQPSTASPIPDFGVTFKFKSQIRATSIAPQWRAQSRLGELGGKKYLRSGIPMMPSLYGPNNKTLIAASEPALQELVSNANQPKTGPLVDRIREVSSGNDLYFAINVAAFRPMLQMGAPMAVSKVSAQGLPLLEIANLVAAAELTFNVATSGPTSLVFHANDDTAAQKLETLIQEFTKRKNGLATQSGQATADDPIKQGLNRYLERIAKLSQVQRSGNDLTIFNLDGQDPVQRKFIEASVLSVAVRILAGVSQPQMQPGPGGVPPGMLGAPVAPGGPGGPAAVTPQPGAPPAAAASEQAQAAPQR